MDDKSIDRIQGRRYPRPAQETHNLSVISGLFMVFSDSMVSRKSLFAGLPSISETDHKNSESTGLFNGFRLLDVLVSFLLTGRYRTHKSSCWSTSTLSQYVIPFFQNRIVYLIGSKYSHCDTFSW